MTATFGYYGQLRAIVERIERLEEEKKTISDDIKEVYKEAKGNGFDVTILRKVVALRKKDAAEPIEELPQSISPVDAAKADVALIDQPQISNETNTVSVEEGATSAHNLKAKPQYTAGDCLAAG